MENQWIIPKRHDRLMTVIYSIVGMILVITLVTLLNYAMWSNHAAK
ncbi:MAG TPA: hypothetical protein VMB02_08710 [Candidatus Aquilonibacter sp.]|nr:hypothetical protein [Candidatus Aquilonibacter sp.]